MRSLTAIAYIALTVCLSSCDQHQAVSNIDPKLGLECFETHRGSLPPGTQYEGIKKRTDDRLTINIMDGVKVVSIDCALTPDGALQVRRE